MRRLLSISFILLALVTGGACDAPPAAHAARGDPPAVAGVTDENAEKVAKNFNLEDGEKLDGIMVRIMSLFAWLVGVAALTLDNAVYYTVVTMGKYVKDLPAVGVTWQIMRDIGNIILIFGFLAVGISIILNTERLGYGKKMLPKLLLAAVFLNFSLFITEAVIDTGNLFATQFYTQINGGQPAGVKDFDKGSFNFRVSNEGISNTLMNKIGLQTLYGAAVDNEIVLDKSNPWYIGFMGIILFIIVAFVMFSLAFILIARFVILLFLIIIAPIGFAGLAVPKLANSASKWWSTLFEQTITAPVLLLLLYIALKIITDDNFMTGFGSKPNFLGFVTGSETNITGFASVMLSFLVAMGLLMAVVIVSKKISAFGGSWAMKTAGALSFGATAWAGRRTVGRISNYTARKIRSTKWGASETGRLLAGTFDRGAKASFDIRGIKAGGGLKALGGIDAGEAQKGGYQAREKELITARTNYAKSLRQSKGQKEVTKAAQDEHDKNMAPLEAEEQAQLKTTKEIVNASREELKLKKQELDAARGSGNQDRIKTAEAAYNNDMNTHKELVEAEREKLDPIRNKMETEKKKLEAATANNNVAANQRKYGEALQSGPVMKILRAPYDWPTAVGSARREAADKIIGESKKDKNQKNLDKLEEILAKSEGKVAPISEDKKPKE